MKQVLIFAVLIIRSFAAAAQGCSDAGFCTAGALRPADSLQTIQNSIGASISVAKGERSTTLLIPQVEWRYSFNNKVQFEARLSFYYANGAIGSRTGIGDPILTLSNKLLENKTYSLKSTIGLRISVGDAGASDKNGRPLPMPYQSNLGTTDLIAGMSLSWKKYLSIAAGWQQPLLQYNANDYYAPDFATEPEGYGSYFSSRKLRRKGDLLFRADGSYPLNRWNFSAGPLLIVHLGKDKIKGNDRQDLLVAGSDGATLNITGTVGYKIKKSRFELTGGSPLVVRKVRPDGLTRSAILTLRYEYLLP